MSRTRIHKRHAEHQQLRPAPCTPAPKPWAILRSTYAAALCIFLLALAVRTIYFLQMKANYPGWDTLMTVDGIYHDLWARQIAGGNLVGNEPFFRAPLYAYFLGMIYAFCGPSIAIPKIIQHVVGSLSCALLFLFADRYFSRRVALTSALAASFCWVLVYFEDELLLDSLLVLFSIALVWLLMRLAEQPVARRFFVSGLVLGLASITRPNYLAMLPVILCWLTVALKGTWQRCAQGCLLICCGCALAVLPVTLHNVLLCSDAVLISSQGGINFYIGNNPQADGVTSNLPGFGLTWTVADCQYQARQETGRLGQAIKPSEVSSFFFRKAMQFIRTEPARWLQLMLKKLLLFWHPVEMANNQNPYFFRQYVSITTILPPFFIWVAPLGLVGLFMLLRRPAKYHIMVYFVLAYMLTVIFFFVTSRFRLPVLPLLLVTASLAFWEIVSAAAHKRYRAAAAYAGSAVMLGAVINFSGSNPPQASDAQSRYNLGAIYLKKGMDEAAFQEFGRALDLAACVPYAHVNRGIFFLKRQDLDSAKKEFEQEIEKCQGSAEAYYHLAEIYRLENDLTQALMHTQSALLAGPNYLPAYMLQALLLEALGDSSSALQVAGRLLAVAPDYPLGLFLRGTLLLRRGMLDEAAKDLKHLVSIDPSGIIEDPGLAIYSLQSAHVRKPDEELLRAARKLIAAIEQERTGSTLQ